MWFIPQGTYNLVEVGNAKRTRHTGMLEAES